MINKLFRLYALLSRPMTLGVRGIVEDDQGRILLVRHTYVKGWHLPGGGVETGQTMEDAMAAELREEARIHDMGELELVGIYLNKKLSKRDHVALYYCRNWGNRKTFSPDREIAEIGFFTRENLPQGVTAGTLRRLGEFYDNTPKSLFW